MDPLEDLHEVILGCRLCQEAGYIPLAAPVVAPVWGRRMMLIGQAPGITELEVRKPFAGRAGKVLFRWMASIGISEEEFRSTVYMTAVTKCFPGKSRDGSGDRKPSRDEVSFCRPYLVRQLALLDPPTILLVGGLAIDLYLKGKPLVEVIGRLFEHEGKVLIPLPHPSGASRWLNRAEHHELLTQALRHVRDEWDRLAMAA